MGVNHEQLLYAGAKSKAQRLCVALAAQPPRPHAAVLFVDFLLSAEARKVLEKFQYGHPSHELPFKRWHPGFGRSLEQFEKDSIEWEKLVKEITRK